MQLLDRTLRLNARVAGATFVLSILMLFATFASGQDMSGVWLGQLSENMPDGTVGHGSLYLRLQQSGDQMSGVAGDSEATASPIENVILSGKHLRFSVTTSRGPEGSVLIRIELDASGDAMEGKGHAFRSSDNHAWDMEIKLARQK